MAYYYLLQCIVPTLFAAVFRTLLQIRNVTMPLSPAPALLYIDLYALSELNFGPNLNPVIGVTLLTVALTVILNDL